MSSSPHPALRAGGVDWIARCREMAASRQTWAARPGGDHWQKRAGRYAKYGPGSGRDAFVDRLLARLRPDDVVCDVGAGTGRHVTHVARAVREVIAVEPSPAMRAELAAMIAREGLTNVKVVADGFPQAEAEARADVVYSAHVFYGAPDPIAFLEAMTRAASREAILCLGPRLPSAALDGLYLAVHGHARADGPGALEALALLWQLGCFADANVIPNTDRPLTFAPEDEDDIRELCHRLHVDDDADGLARVRRAVRELGAPIEGEPDRVAFPTVGPNVLIAWPTRAAHL
ncbi:MAG: class I SAM-dependent methyltransferase [Polyangiaceae bacterium]